MSWDTVILKVFRHEEDAKKYVEHLDSKLTKYEKDAYNYDYDSFEFEENLVIQ